MIRPEWVTKMEGICPYLDDTECTTTDKKCEDCKFLDLVLQGV